LEKETMNKNLTKLYVILMIISTLISACVVKPEQPTPIEVEGTTSIEESTTPTIEVVPEEPVQTDPEVETQPEEPPTEAVELPISFIEITSPQNGAVLDPSQPIEITGRGGALFEGNVVIQITDSAGNVLVIQPTIIASPTAGTGGEGSWSLELNIAGELLSAGTITAFSPSPKDGSWLASDFVEVVFNQEAGNIFMPSLEKTLWILTAFADDTLNPLLATYLVSMQFDPETGTAAGKAACNNYFASYEISAEKITLGPAGSTMMMCPEPQMNLEYAFHAALAEVAGYQLENETLTLINAAGELLFQFQVDPYAVTNLFTREALGTTIYMCQHADPCTVQLSNGEYFEPIENSAAYLTVRLANYAAFGDLDNDEVEEAVVVLITDTSGSGTFYDLAVVKNHAGDLINTAITLLGDRIQISSLSVEYGVIVVDMLTAGPDDPLCCPNTPVVQRYQLSGGELILLGE
jgi:hypothetical protein